VKKLIGHLLRKNFALGAVAHALLVEPLAGVQKIRIVPIVMGHVTLPLENVLTLVMVAETRTTSLVRNQSHSSDRFDILIHILRKKINEIR